MIINKKDVIPVGNRLLIEPFKQAAETTEGLIISEGEGYASPVVGTVIRLGDTKEYSVGDVLLFRRYSVDSLKVYDDESEKEIYLLECSEVVARVSDGELVEPPKEYEQARLKVKANQDAKVTNSESKIEGKEVSSEEGNEKGRKEG